MSALRIDEYPGFAKEALLLHNELRQKHGVSDLILNKELCGMAQEWADQCAKKKSIAQRGDPEYGENVFCSGKKNASVQDAVTAWYAEGEKFPYGTENVKKNKYQFTQLVWKDTTDLGVGMATSVNGKVFVIANYYPKGNMPGTFSANVVQVVAN